MGKFIDIAGQRFGRLIVIKLDHMDKEKGSYWLCKCDCGNEKIVSGRCLRDLHTASCGCLNLENKNRTDNIERLKKIGFNNRKGVIALYNKIYWHTLNNAKSRNIEFLLTKDDVKNICEQNCFYCGKKDNRKNKHTGEYFYVVGIDRLDNETGYFLGNVVPCCRMCNVSKNNYNKNIFYQWIEQVYNNLKEKGEI